MLIATLPTVHEQGLIERIINHPLIGGVRYNTGLCSPYSAQETLKRILNLTRAKEKSLWIDLKGRQLRITKWSYPKYGGQIILNHEIETDGPAVVHFRGGGFSELKVIRGSTIYVDPPPQYAVGEGQSINITGANITVKGYLTPEDRNYISAACQLGLNDFMLSFFEQDQDINEVANCIQESLGYDVLCNPNYVLKIESLKGLDYLRRNKDRMKNCTLMAARDDLMIQIFHKPSILTALEEIIEADSEAICASYLFSSLSHGEELSLSDYSDLHLMRKIGYKHFLLSDEICRYSFNRAMECWQTYLSTFGAS